MQKISNELLIESFVNSIQRNLSYDFIMILRNEIVRRKNSGEIAMKELIDFVDETYNLDSNKKSLTGHSMGGTGVWNIAVSYPDLFSSIAPLSGSIKRTESNINALSNIPV